jgi:beta-lactamase superfamily II metal-dependent hydrolase
MRAAFHRPLTSFLLACAAVVLLAVGCGPVAAAPAAPTANAAPAASNPGAPKPAAGTTQFIVFNVGQADAMLVLHGGKSMLVDAGVARDKRSRPAFRDIPRRLEALTGRRHLDYMVVTHYHADHIGSHASGRDASLGELGLWGLIADERVTIGTLVDRGFLIFGEKGATQKSYEASLPLWMKRAIQRRVAAKDRMTIDMGPGLTVEVVAVNGAGRLLEIHRKRPGFFDQYPPSENDYSIALKFTQGDFELFSGGDLTGQDTVRQFGTTASSYNDIESRVAQRVGDVEVYRVNHHGSDHSSNACFLQVLHPEVSIISVGQNGYGHPAPRVYEALKKTGRVILTGGAARAVYYTVKQDIKFGDVEILVEPDGKNYTVDGTRYRSLTEEQERARPNFIDRCSEPASRPAVKAGEGADEDTVVKRPKGKRGKGKRGKHEPGTARPAGAAKPSAPGKPAVPPVPAEKPGAPADQGDDDGSRYDDTPGD